MPDTKDFAKQLLESPEKYGVPVNAVLPKDWEPLRHFLMHATQNWTSAFGVEFTQPVLTRDDGDYGLKTNPCFIASPPPPPAPVAAPAAPRLPNLPAAALQPKVAAYFAKAQAAEAPAPSAASLVAEYFADVFEAIRDKGLHKLDNRDLYHGHLFKGRDGGSYIIFHAKENVRGAVRDDEVGSFDITDPNFRYRNILWDGSIGTIWALDAQGALDASNLPTVDSTEVFKNLVFPYFAGIWMDPASAKFKTVDQGLLGDPRGILCYRFKANLPKSQRIVFNKEQTSGTVISWQHEGGPYTVT